MQSASALLEEHVRRHLQSEPPCALEIRKTTGRGKGRGLFVRSSMAGLPLPTLLHREPPLCIMSTTPQLCDGCRVELRRRAVCAGCECIVWCVACATSPAVAAEHADSGKCGVFRAIDFEQRRSGAPRRQFWLRFAARACLCARNFPAGWRLLLGLASPIADPCEPDASGDGSRQQGGGDSNDDGDWADARSLSLALSAARFEAASGGPPSPTEALLLLAAVGANAIQLHAQAPLCGECAAGESAAGEGAAGEGKGGAGAAAGHASLEAKGAAAAAAVAWALYPCAAMLNHSCAPAAAWDFEPCGTIRVVSLASPGRGLEPRQRAAPDGGGGAEVCVSYLPRHLLSPANRLRRMAALAEFGFSCACSRCVREAEGEAEARGSHNGEVHDRTSGGGPGDAESNLGPPKGECTVGGPEKRARFC